MNAAGSRARRIALAGIGVVSAWIFLDLYLPLTLPGAPRLEHAVFLMVGFLARLMEEEVATDVLVLDVTVLAAVGLGAAGLAAWRFGGRWVWRFGLLGLTLAQLGFVVIACLMERAGAAGIAVAAFVWWRGRGGDSTRPEEEAATRRAAVGSLLIGALPLVYLFAVFTASSDGYGLLGLLDGAGSALYIAWLLLAVVAGAAAGGLLHRSKDLDSRPLMKAIVAGLVTAAAARFLLDPGAPWLSIPLLVGAGAAIVGALPTGPASFDPIRWPRLLLPATLAALLLFSHTYAARVFACPTALPAGVERIADGGDIFEVVLGRDGNVLALSSRSERRFLALRVQPEVGEVRATDPVAIPSPPDGPPGTTYGYAEELQYLPDQDQFLGTVVAVSHDFFLQENSPAHDVNNALVRISGDGARAESLHGRSRLCWVGNLVWDSLRSRVLIGCEYDSRIWTYDPEADEIAYGMEAVELADVAAFAVDDRPERGFVYTVSMWLGDRITKLDGDSLEILDQRRVGDAHYALELDPKTNRLFASSYYRSVVSVIDADSLETIDVIPTGLGARAVGVDPERGLVVVSSVYDGLLRICRTEDASVVRRLKVGGHVKDIAIDKERGLAYFANSCGIFRLDLNVVGE
jgi:hypothetical protein